MNDENPDIGRSESGSPIYYHKAAREFEAAIGYEDTIQQVSDHIEQHIGDPAQVYHEIVSDKVHLDIHIVNPTPQRNYYTLVTSGMSDRPMTVPQGAEAYRYAEMMLCLPPDWNMDQNAWSDERHYWPIRWLKTLARLPHEYDTWLGYYHTIPNGDPPRPFARNTQLCCAMVFYPVLFPREFHTLPVDEDRTIYFYSMLSLYEEEMNLKLQAGAGALLDRLESAGVTELLDIKRPNVMQPK